MRDEHTHSPLYAARIGRRNACRTAERYGVVDGEGVEDEDEDGVGAGDALDVALGAADGEGLAVGVEVAALVRAAISSGVLITKT